MNVFAAARRHPIVACTFLTVALTAFLTWPQIRHLRSEVASHNDAFFSIWRLTWVAHALQSEPERLYDGNIYHPHRRTLAYSDATLLQGALAAPMLWAGLLPTTVYNLLLLGAIAASGVAMFVLARHVTGNVPASLVGAAAFTLLPYRIDHYMHLELQWTMWIPLTFWAIHRTIERRSWRQALLAGVLLWLQIVSCVYYGMFLALTLVPLSVMLLAVQARAKDVPVSVACLALAAGVAAVLTWPYTEPYLENARLLGERPAHEIRMYSAPLVSYVTWPDQNWLWGWTGQRFTSNELHLAPGVVVTLAALVGLAGRPRRFMWIYAAITLLALDVSLGVNGFIYPHLMTYIAPMRSLRAPARFSILAFTGLSVLVALGVDTLQRLVNSPRARNWLVAGAVLLIAVESGSAPAILMKIPTSTPDVYRYVMGQGRSVLAELPMPNPNAMPAFDPYYEYFSRAHWFPLVNGYSGYHPPEYVNTLTDMLTFPDDQSIARLRHLDVRFVIVHTHLYEREEFIDLMLSIAKYPELVSHGRYRDWAGEAEVFELIPESK